MTDMKEDEMNSRTGTPGYRELRAEYNVMFDGHDPWGSNIGWLFAISEVLTHWAGVTSLPWDFHDSPAHGNWQPEDDGYIAERLCELHDDGYVTDDDLITFGTVLSRYDDILRAAWEELLTMKEDEMKERTMTYSGPQVMLDTAYGPVEVTWTDGDHAHVSAYSDGQRPGHVTYRDRRWYLSVHVYRGARVG
jgi:hypothetical protein